MFLLRLDFGIFFSGGDSGTGMTMQTVFLSINEDYENKITAIIEKNTYDVLEVKGLKVVWKEVLALYSVKVNTDYDNPQIEEMIEEYGFNEMQISYLDELLANGNDALWSAILYGISSTSEDIVAIA